MINTIKKKEDKKDRPLDKEKEKSLMAAEHIIVIRDTDKTDDDSDDESEPDYEQLMAEGTVIVIKDDDTVKKYTKFVQKEKKKEQLKK